MRCFIEIHCNIQPENEANNQHLPYWNGFNSSQNTQPSPPEEQRDMNASLTMTRKVGLTDFFLKI